MQFRCPLFLLGPIFLLTPLSHFLWYHSAETNSDCCSGKGTSLSSFTGLRLLLWELPPLKFLDYYQIEAALNLPGFLFRCMCQEKVEEKNRGSQLSKGLALSFTMNSELHVIHLQATMYHPSSFLYLLYLLAQILYQRHGEKIILSAPITWQRTMMLMERKGLGEEKNFK